MGMPETVRLIDEDGILKFPAEQVGTEYIRADLAVLATTHQRTLEELREAATDTLASLVAAVSLLERGGKRAAPSDKMFHTMLADYNASIKRARAALRAKGGEHGG